MKLGGVILAGGLSRRMGGGDKPLRILGDKTLLAHVIERAAPQVSPLVLNVNGDASRFAAYDLPCVADCIEGYAGPLAGVLTGMEWLQANVPDCTHLVTFAADAPFLPGDLVERLVAPVADGDAELTVAVSGGRTHPVFGLWPLALKDALRSAMIEEGLRRVDIFTGRYDIAEVAWDMEPHDPFFNANRPEDLEQATALL